MENKIINCNGIKISNKNKICLIAGPCQLETEQHALDMAGKIKEILLLLEISIPLQLIILFSINKILQL